MFTFAYIDIAGMIFETQPYLRADSVLWNLHKMVGVPLQCTALLVQQKVGFYVRI